MYKWQTINVGDDFTFNEGVTLRSAQQMASRANKLYRPKRFKVWVDPDTNEIYCERVE